MSRSKSDFFNSWKSDNFPKIEEAFKEKGIDVVEEDATSGVDAATTK